MRKFLLLLLLVFSFAVWAQPNTLRVSESIYFASASAELDAQALEELEAFALRLRAYAAYELAIEAFTDEQGGVDYNEDLARRRATAVRIALDGLNVESATTEIMTYGERRARQNTLDDKERQTDRRVDLVATVTQWESAAAAINAARAEQLQTFTAIDPTQRQTIYGQQGGVFLLEANALVRPDGTPAIGPIVVELVEAYNMADMVVAGLTTTAGGKRLVTGGMLRLTAQDADGTELQLAEGSSFAASIPTDDFNERMRIFSGLDHADPLPTTAAAPPVDWSPEPQRVAASAEALLGFAPAKFKKNEFAVLIDKMVYTVMREWHSANPAPKEPTYLRPSPYSRKVPAPIDTNEIFFKPQGLDKILMPKKERDQRTRKKRRQAVSIYDAQVKRHLRAKQSAETMPARNAVLKSAYETAEADWEARRKAKEAAAREKFMERFREKFEARQAEIAAAYRVRREAFERAMLEYTERNGTGANVARYFFTVTQLGWANCDIFYGETDERIEVLASLPGSDRSTSVLLIPTDRPSLLAYSPATEAEGWQLTNIPRGVGYRIVAYQVIDGQLMFAHVTVTAANEQVEQLTFKPVALRDLKQKIAAVLEG